MLAKKHEAKTTNEEDKNKQKIERIGGDRKKFKKKNYRDIPHHKRKLYCD